MVASSEFQVCLQLKRVLRFVKIFSNQRLLKWAYTIISKSSDVTVRWRCHVMYKSKLAVKVCFSNLVNTAIMELCDLTLITLFMPAKLTPNVRAPVALWPELF